MLRLKASDPCDYYIILYGLTRRFALSSNRGSFGLNREDEAPTEPEVKIITHII